MHLHEKFMALAIDEARKAMNVFEGLIRWDKNEASWVDVLDGTKEIDRKKARFQ